jgi:hypothetical protein
VSCCRALEQTIFPLFPSMVSFTLHYQHCINTLHIAQVYSRRCQKGVTSSGAGQGYFDYVTSMGRGTGMPDSCLPGVFILSAGLLDEMSRPTSLIWLPQSSMPADSSRTVQN